MCTVSFIPSGGKVFLTSNRDEKHYRSSAIPPEVYAMQTGKILFPRDRDAGGTWAAIHENSNAIIFLNGGFVRHEPRPPYRKSRGLVLLDLIDSASPVNAFRQSYLENIEPFTAIIYESGTLYECRWDGNSAFTTEKDTRLPQIWSSVTLYDDEVIAKRNQWYSEWLVKFPTPGREDILNFHQFTGDGDGHNDLRMNRDGVVFTVSITSLVLNTDNASMKYLDLKNNRTYQQELGFRKTSLIV